jgi:hypothetical protein
MTDATPSPTPSSAPRARRRGRARGSVLLAALTLTAVAASAAASATLSEPAPPTIEQRLQAQIDDMVAGGVDPDSPKLALLQEELDALRAGADARPRKDVGVDMEARLGADVDAAAAEGRAADAGGEPLWESGPVTCEVVPGLLGPDAIAGAACASVPQPDGTNRYVAVAPDGTVRAVLFGPDGRVARVADTRLPAPPAPGAAVAVTPEGDLQVTAPGEPPVVVDVP